MYLEETGVYLDIILKQVQEQGDKFVKNAGNHAITYALYDEKSYFLDPTQFRMYRLQDDGFGIFYDGYGRGVIKSSIFSALNEKENKNSYDLKKEILKFRESVLLEEEQGIISSTLNICRNNMDIFEKFYRDNQELHNEISNRFARIRKK